MVFVLGTHVKSHRAALLHIVVKLYIFEGTIDVEQCQKAMLNNILHVLQLCESVFKHRSVQRDVLCSFKLLIRAAVQITFFLNIP